MVGLRMLTWLVSFDLPASQRGCTYRQAIETILKKWKKKEIFFPSQGTNTPK